MTGRKEDSRCTPSPAPTRTVAKNALVVDPLKSAAISYDNAGNFPGFFLCQVDLEGSPKRTFRARVRTATDSLVLN